MFVTVLIFNQEKKNAVLDGNEKFTEWLLSNQTDPDGTITAYLQEIANLRQNEKDEEESEEELSDLDDYIFLIFTRYET